MAAEAVAPDSPPESIHFIPPSIHPDAIVNGSSYLHLSPIPPALLTPSDPNDTSSLPPCAIGIDEAGRGPVLGPMVYGAFFLPIAQSDTLLRHANHRFDDSKILSPAVRASLVRLLCDPSSALHASCGWAVSSLSARDIAAGMLRSVAPYNLNSQAFDATVDLIRAIYAQGINVEHIFVDTVGQPAAYQARLQRVFPTARITVAKKADSLYPCVSAASVCAKVTRDVALDVLYRSRIPPLEQHVSDEPAWGSGYPSDARCVSWLKQNMHPVFGWGPECRFSWSTARDMLEEKKDAIKVDWPPDNDDDDSVTRMTDFFIPATKTQETNELTTWFGTCAGLEAF
ncbi:hypothetical protein CDD81_6508 [Ophiocordyceps australis]|uniref:Ribonuclease n=1 Tax=Ophiocordyceps australis TaxID=1399860 RepID=A0A2C5YID2_9HYPO|nr:hypothetical protein CDD81_6508 [Ophiocordyceps australis]